MKAPKKGSCEPIAPLELPHSLHAFHRVAESDELNMVRQCNCQLLVYHIVVSSKMTCFQRLNQI